MFLAMLILYLVHLKCFHLFLVLYKLSPSYEWVAFQVFVIQFFYGVLFRIHIIRECRVKRRP
jgi:hypothetical protein